MELEEWKNYFDQGIAYRKTVLGTLKNRSKFGNSLIYNIIGLSLECILAGLLMKNGRLAEHSSVGNMLRMLKDNYPDMPESFKEESRFFNRFMDYYCSLEIGTPLVPTDQDLMRMVGFMNQVGEWARKKAEGHSQRFKAHSEPSYN